MVESLTRGLGNGIPIFVVAALPRLSAGLDQLDDLDTVHISSTAIFAVARVTTDGVAIWVDGKRIAVVVSVDTTLEVSAFPGFNSAKVVRQESLDTENAIKIFYTLVVPSPDWIILCGLVDANKSIEESWVRLQHDPVHVGTHIRVGAGEVGWIIDGVTGC